MTSETESQPSQEKQEKDGAKSKLVLVRPDSLTDEDLRLAAERLFTALTGKKGKVGVPIPKRKEQE